MRTRKPEVGAVGVAVIKEAATRYLQGSQQVGAVGVAVIKEDATRYLQGSQQVGAVGVAVIKEVATRCVYRGLTTESLLLCNYWFIIILKKH